MNKILVLFKSKYIPSTSHPLYYKWRTMKKRCYLMSDKDYPKYGGRGILICNKWLSFSGFVEDMGESYEVHISVHGRKNTTIERTDNDKGYSPDNCRWATVAEQNQNKRVKMIKYKGKLKKISEWAEELGLSPQTLRQRISISMMPLNKAMKSNKYK